MNKTALRKIIMGCYSDVIFTYNGKKSGVTSEVHNSVATFQVWHGLETREYSDIDAVMNDKFFSGNSLEDLAEKVEFTVL